MKIVRVLPVGVRRDYWGTSYAIVGKSTAVAPPSTVSTAPVTADACSLARNATTAATSPGSAGRRSGTCAVASAYAASLPASPRSAASASIYSSAIGVRTHPGHTVFTRTPRLPKSLAIDLAKPIRPCLALT